MCLIEQKRAIVRWIDIKRVESKKGNKATMMDKEKLRRHLKKN